mgnify:CR=1 FL=1
MLCQTLLTTPRRESGSFGRRGRPALVLPATWLALLTLALSAGFLPADDGESSLALSVAPSVAFPVGRDTDYLRLGGTGSVGVLWNLPTAVPLFVSGEVDYGYSPLQAEAASLSTISGSAGLGVDFALGDLLSLQAFGKGGYFYGFLDNDFGSGGANPCVQGGAGLSFRPTPSWAFNLLGTYRMRMGLCNTAEVALATVFTPGAPARWEGRAAPSQIRPEAMAGAVNVSSVEFESVFPVFFTYYNEYPVGTVTLRNTSELPAENIILSFYVRQYMDNPKVAPAPERLEPGEETEVDVYALFTESILQVTEGTKASSVIALEYSVGGTRRSEELIEVVTVNNRNAVTWDDDRKACAFVTAKDPAVLRFSKNVTGFLQGQTSRAVDENLQTAMALHEALDLFGITYVIDPTTPYAELSASQDSIDFLQFPKQTLEYLAGDCDDLSILYTALLEAVGIETAFITVPGHIYTAFALEMSPDHVENRLNRAEDVITRDGKAWVPVEITLRRQGFLRAWDEGAKQWRLHHNADQAGFHPMHEGWALYEPVGFPGTPSLSFPEREEVLAAFSGQLIKFIDQEIYPQVARLEQLIERRPDDLRWPNKLGVLYARYGREDLARRHFTAVLNQDPDYSPALLNLGNLHYLKREFTQAREYYERAWEADPESPTAVLAVAKVNHEIENYGTAREAFARLETLDPALAEEFAYIDLRGAGTGRAADAARLKGNVVWDEAEEPE